MNEVAWRGALALVLIALLVVAGTWIVVGRDTRRRWIGEMREIGFGRTLLSAASVLILVFGTAMRTQTDLAFPAYMSALLGLSLCMVVGFYLGAREARRRYPDDYDDVRLGRPLRDASIRRDFYWVVAKPVLWSLVPGWLWIGFVHLVWR